MSDLECLDPESEAQCSPLVECIASELGARIAVGDDPKTPDGLKRLSELIADAVLDRFVVRARKIPRYRWTQSWPWSTTSPDERRKDQDFRLDCPATRSAEADQAQGS
jgi:hypothetical protein